MLGPEGPGPNGRSVAQLVAAASRALGLPINRSTVVVHADINGVSRRSDPWPPATREARVKRVIARANAILVPPILAQVAGIDLDDGTVAAVVGAVGSAPRPIAIDRARLDRQTRELALDHAAG